MKTLEETKQEHIQYINNLNVRHFTASDIKKARKIRREKLTYSNHNHHPSPYIRITPDHYFTTISTRVSTFELHLTFTRSETSPEVIIDIYTENFHFKSEALHTLHQDQIEIEDKSELYREAQNLTEKYNTILRQANSNLRFNSSSHFYSKEELQAHINYLKSKAPIIDQILEQLNTLNSLVESLED